MNKRIFLYLFVILLFAAIAAAADKPDGGYAVFDGTGDYVIVNDDNSLDIVNEITLSAWVYKNSDTLNEFGIVEKGAHATLGEYTFVILSGENLRLMLNNNAGQVNGATMVSNNAWHHVAATYDGSQMKVYLDGVLDGTVPYSGPISVSTNFLRIGRYYDGSSRDFNGRMDEVTIYNRSLTAQEITQTYQRGLLGRKSNITNGSVSYYDFENNGTADNTQWKDKIGINHGTPNGEAYTIEHIGGFGKLDGAGYIGITNNAPLSPGTGNFSVTTWFKISQISTAGYIYNDYGSNTDNLVSIAISGDNSLLTFFRDGTDNMLSVDLSTNYVDNNWHYVAWIRNGTKADLYVDGAIAGSDSNLDIGNINTADGLCANIGSYQCGTGYYPTGAIDELQIYSRALSPSEIQQTYQLGLKGLKSNITSGLVGYWPMDTNWSDLSGNENTGTANGGAFNTNLNYSGNKISQELNSAGAVLTDTSGNLIGATTAQSTLQIRRTGAKKVEFTAEGVLDLSSVSVDSDSGRTVVSGLSSSTPGVVGTHTIFIPNVNGNGVYICPSAIQLSDVTESCPGKITLVCPGTSGGLTCSIDGSDYKITDLTSSGGGNNPPGGVSDAVPEFSDYALILAISATIAGLALIRRR